MSAPRGATVVLASAGSGKTYSLTTHYLRLVAAGVPPERCLATTFTRKAAGEILDRLFGRLVAAARDEQSRAELERALEGGELSREAAAELVASLARRVDRCRVMTIDAFFVVLGRALAAELGLAPDWSIADEFRELRARETAVARALEKGSTERWILLLRELERARAKRAVHATLVARVRDAHDLYLEAPESAWTALRPPAPPSDDEIARFERCLAELVLPRTGKGAPSKAWAGALAKARQRVAERDWAAVAADGVAAKVLADEDEYSGFAISGEARALFGELLRAAAADQGALICRQNRATRELIADFDGEFAALLAERGWVRFADLPRWLARGEGSARERLAELAWRLDSEFDHLLLDEFQDTSPAQWRVLQPFAEELAADGTGTKSFFCVGDTKQSIYGWRGGDPRLLEGIARWPNVERRSLAVSRRSAPAVLEVVNRVFTGLDATPLFTAEPERLAAARAFRFEPHSAADPSRRGAARALVARVESNADADGVRQACRAAAVQCVLELADRAPRATIGMLVRRKAQVGALVYALRQRGLAASGESGNPVTDASTVQVALSALHLAEHPSDGAARFHVAHSPLAKPLGLEPDAEPAVVAARARELRRSVVERGYAATLEGFRGAFSSASAWERRRFERLIELAIAWEDEPGLTIDDFVARAREERVEDPSSAAIKVMTIHAAKGLEFDAVVLCDLGYAFGSVLPALVWRRAGEDPTREVEAVSRYALQALRKLLAFAGEPLLADLHAATSTRALYDELCALYVALTRARRELVLVLPPVSSESRELSGASIIARALGLVGRSADAGEWRVEGSDEGWVEDLDAAESAPEPVADEAPRIVFGRANSRGGVASPSKAGTARVTPLRLVLARGGPARLRGLRLHAWMECVGWLDEFRATDAELVEVARARDLDGDGLARDLADFRRLLASDPARDVLARPAGDWELWRERRYLLPLDSGDCERGTFDRVAVERSGGAARRARIVDFKSDAGLDAPQRLAERVLHHAPQMRAYRAALARILAIAPESIAAELWFLEAGVVRAV